jgi:hypothetical protein
MSMKLKKKQKKRIRYYGVIQGLTGSGKSSCRLRAGDWRIIKQCEDIWLSDTTVQHE